MEKDWFARLVEAIDEHPDSRRTISERSGMASSYVQHMIKYGKQPSVENFLAVCAAIGRDPVEILTGVRRDEDLARLLKLFGAMPEAQRRAFLDYLDTLSRDRPQDAGE